MIKRILALLVLVGVCGGGAWFFLRNTPGKAVLRLREKIEYLVFKDNPEGWAKVVTPDELAGRSLSEPGVRFDIARDASDRVLEILPLSQSDMEVRGVLEERAGNPSEALRWYDRVVARPRSIPRVNLRRAAILERLGLVARAKGALASVLDEFPFKANYGIGRLELKTLRAPDAYRAFRRALDNAGSDEERREAYEGIVDALDVLVVVAGGDAEGDLAQLPLDEIARERESALDEAVSLWRRMPTSSRASLVRSHLKSFELLRRKRGEEALDQAIEVLEKAVKNDDERRLVPLYLAIAAAEIDRAYTADPAKRSQFVARVEESIRRAFSYRPEPSELANIAKTTGWVLGQLDSVEEYETLVLVRACQGLLVSPEFIRVLGDETAGGESDPLELSSRLDRAIRSETLHIERKRSADLVKIWALLKAGRSEAASTALDALLQSESDAAERSSLVLRTLHGLARYEPTAISAFLPRLEGLEFPSRASALSAIRVLREANLAIAPLRDDELAARLRSRLETMIEGFAKDVSDEGEVLVAAGLMASAISTERALPILERGLQAHPRSDSILYALGVTYGDMARRAGSADLHARAFESLLAVYRSRPHSNDVLSRIRALAPNTPGAAVTAAVQRVFECTSADAEWLAGILGPFVRGDYRGVLSAETNSSAASRPFARLLLGIACLERRRELLQEAAADRFAGRIDPAKLDARVADLRERARREFDAGLALEESYLPIVLEVARLDLDEASDLDSVEAVAARVLELARAHSTISQIHFLHAVALNKLRRLDIGRRGTLIQEERNALRRAIQSNPSAYLSYSALAMTYVDSDAGARRREADHEQAIGVLKSAPPVPAVLRQIGDLYRALEKYEEARRYYELVISAEPVEQNLTRMVSTFVDEKDFEGARAWLEDLDRRAAGEVDRFRMTRRSLFALVAAAEASASTTTATRRDELEREQIDRYTANIEAARARGERPAAYVINNLAYLLAKRGDAARGLELIRPLREEVVRSAESQPRALVEAVDETYAWCLYSAGELDKAIEIYRKLCSERNNLEFHLNYAEVLYDDRQFEEAERQVETVLNAGLEVSDALGNRAVKLQNRIQGAIQKRFDQQFLDRR